MSSLYNDILNESTTLDVLSLPEPIYPENFDFVDLDCKLIAEYLYNNINATFYDALRYNIVKTYRTFNDIFIPSIDFPVLKVYKLAELDNVLLAPQLLTDFNISYALAYTQKQKVPDVSSFVASEIRRLLKNAGVNNLFQVDWDKGITITYDTFINPDNLIYRYATITASIYTMDD